MSNSIAGVSVIMCCYNSAARLPETLRYLEGQIVPKDLEWEIILVNNSSTDNTIECAEEIWKSSTPNNATCRIVNEAIPGQMHARKKGVREAKYECIIFCDDDNWLSENYVRVAREILSGNERIGAAGGKNFPTTDASAYPDWFEEYRDKYAIGVPAQKSGDVTHRGFVLGAGLVTRRSVFLEVFDDRYPSLLNGRNGEILTTGDDFEYCKRLMLWGYTLYFDERLSVDHFIPKERLTVSYRDRLMDGIDQATKILSVYDKALILKNKNQYKNKWRLLALAPFRILFSSLGLSKRNAVDEKLVFFYLAPFSLKSDHVKMAIKKFLQHK